MHARLEGTAPSVESQQAHNPTKALITSEIDPANSLACSQLLEIEPVVTAHRGLAVGSAQASLVTVQPLTPSMSPLRCMKIATEM